MLSSILFLVAKMVQSTMVQCCIALRGAGVVGGGGWGGEGRVFVIT